MPAARLVARLRATTMQTRLIAMAIAIALLAGVAGMTVMNRVARQEAERLHDREMHLTALLLLGLSAHEIDEMGPDVTPEAIVQNQLADTQDTLGDDYRFQVLSPDGKLLVGNHLMPDRRPMRPLDRLGYDDMQMDGETWRVYVYHDADQRKTVQLAERESHRRWAVTPDAPMVAMAVLGFGLTLAVSLLLLRGILSPLREVAGALHQRNIESLDPITMKDAPPDVQPVVDSINELMARVSRAFERERGFTAVAAHELRTPLASLRLLADAAAAAVDDEERRSLLAELRQSIDRCSHLQTQLLTLARLDAVAKGQDHETFELADVIVDAQSDLLPLAGKRGVKLASTLCEATMRGHRFGVRTLVGNLLANAVRYTPAGGRVEVAARVDGRHIVVQVDDSGPGIPATERERVFERFVRLHRGSETGVGLGLAIVRTVVEAHGASVRLGESHLGGLSVVVGFEQAIAPGPAPAGGFGGSLAST